MTVPSKVPLSHRPRPVLIAAACLAAWYLLVFVGVIFAVSGVMRAPNNHMPLSVTLLLGYVAMAIVALFPLAWALMAWKRNDLHAVRYFAVAALLCLAGPMILVKTSREIARMAEERDFRRLGMEELRAETAWLIGAAKTKNYPKREDGLFGAVVPAADLPPKLREISERVPWVTVDEQGVVLILDGMGSWRGGYLITPSSGIKAPANALWIAEGFYYVTQTMSPEAAAKQAAAVTGATPTPDEVEMAPRRLW